MTPLSARVRYQRPRDYTPARTHLFLRVEIGGVPWMADVGVGASRLSSAIRLDADRGAATSHEPRRIIREDAGWFFHQVRFGDDWQDVLEFTGEEMPLNRPRTGELVYERASAVAFPEPVDRRPRTARGRPA